MTGNEHRGHRTLGVAVEVPDPYATLLAEMRRAAGDPLADHMAPHITLVPPVRVAGPPGQVEQVLRSAAAEVGPFEVHLRGTGTFRPDSQVVFVAVATGRTALERLAAALQVHPLDPPRTFPYHPHVTVAMDVPAPALDEVHDRLAGFEARFEVHSFRLYEHDRSRPGRRWHPVHDVPLAGPPGTGPTGAVPTLAAGGQ